MLSIDFVRKYKYYKTLIRPNVLVIGEYMGNVFLVDVLLFIQCGYPYSAIPAYFIMLYFTYYFERRSYTLKCHIVLLT